MLVENNLKLLCFICFLWVMAASVPAPASTLGHDIGSYLLLRLGGGPVKWGSSEMGTGASVTYAFVTEAMDFPAAHNCRRVVPVTDMLARSGIAMADFERQAVAAVSMWQAAANVVFDRVETPDTADILIGARAEPRGWAYADVFPTDVTGISTGSVRSITRALVCLNPIQPWKVGFGGTPQAHDLRYTLLHEIGHTIGLDHPSPFGQVMSFTYSEAYSVLQPGDVDGAVRLYGHPIASATVVSRIVVR